MNEDNVKALVEKTVKSYGRLDYAFNNAGVVEDPASFTNKTSSIFDKIMAINVKGVWHLCIFRKTGMSYNTKSV